VAEFRALRLVVTVLVVLEIAAQGVGVDLHGLLEGGLVEGHVLSPQLAVQQVAEALQFARGVDDGLIEDAPDALVDEVLAKT
jgi:hypothetical protein